MEVPLPRIALYFRWQPEAGETLTPEKVFQCLFMPGSTMAERRYAAERRLSPDEFCTIVRRQDPSFARNARFGSTIKCHHCHQPLPLSAFTTMTLRPVEKGE